MALDVRSEGPKICLDDVQIGGHRRCFQLFDAHPLPRIAPVRQRAKQLSVRRPPNYQPARAPHGYDRYHDVSLRTLEEPPPTDVVGILEGMRTDGKLQWIGAGFCSANAACDAIGAGSYDCLQVHYNIVDRRPEGRLLLEAANNDVGMVARSVLLKGALTHRHERLPKSLAPLRNHRIWSNSFARGGGGEFFELYLA